MSLISSPVPSTDSGYGHKYWSKTLKMERDTAMMNLDNCLGLRAFPNLKAWRGLVARSFPTRMRPLQASYVED